MTINCPVCGYDLGGQTNDRCPECGQSYDWENLRQRIEDETARARRSVRTAWIAPAFLLGVIVTETFLASGSWTVALLMALTSWVALIVFGINAIVFAAGVSSFIEARVRGYVSSRPSALLVFGCVVALFGVPAGLLAGWDILASHFIINRSAWP